jgi:hypothetical protein
MALKKEIEVRDTGVKADYLRVEDIQFSKVHNELRIHIGLYLSKGHKDNGKSPIDTLNVLITEASLATLTGSNIIEMAYNKIKELPEFADALDV